MDERFSSDQVCLCEAVCELLAAKGLSPDDPLGSDIACLLAAPGKVLAGGELSARLPNGCWALLSLAIARYGAPSSASAVQLRVALCCEFLLCALDAFDEIEDDDGSQVRAALGDGRFLNAATCLLTLASQSLGSLAPDLLSYERAHMLGQRFLEELITAMHGQHQDLLMEGADVATFPLERALRIAAEKSGTLFQLVCRLSAEAVGTTAELAGLLGDIGSLMGTVAQLENDAHDLESELTSQEGSGQQEARKSDLRRGKKTLPMVLASQQYVALRKDGGAPNPDGQIGAWEIAVSRAVTATLGAAVHLRERAASLVPAVERLCGEAMPAVLRTLLTLDRMY
jgi:geranylgeranyl pyrophosphate synthase